MRIGQIAKLAGVSTSLLRYYEEQGLLGTSARTEAGYRVYGTDTLGRLRFIQRAKSLGLSLREIRQLVNEPADSTTEVARLRHAIAHKVAATQRRIAELEALRQELEALYQRLGDGAVLCGHIGDCDCWLPSGKEVNEMTNQAQALPLFKTALAQGATARGNRKGTLVLPVVRELTLNRSAEDACSCCGCTCPSDGDACSCCGCTCP